MRVNRLDFLRMLTIIQGYGFYPSQEEWQGVPPMWGTRYSYGQRRAKLKDQFWQRFNFVSSFMDVDASELLKALRTLVKSFKDGQPLSYGCYFENGAMFNQAREWYESGAAKDFAMLILPIVELGPFGIQRDGSDLVLTSLPKRFEEISLNSL